MKVIDNVLPSYLQDYVEQSVRNRFKWDFLPDVTYANSGDPELKIPGFGYSMLHDGKKALMFNQFEAIMLIISQKIGLPYESISRIRFGLSLPLVNRPKHHNIHKDMQNIPHTVCLYYVSDSDGPTYFFDEDKQIIDKVIPKKGRAVVFDGQTYHASSCPTEGVRIVCNIIYA